LLAPKVGLALRRCRGETQNPMKDQKGGVEKNTCWPYHTQQQKNIKSTDCKGKKGVGRNPDKGIEHRSIQTQPPHKPPKSKLKVQKKTKNERSNVDSPRELPGISTGGPKCRGAKAIKQYCQREKERQKGKYFPKGGGLHFRRTRVREGKSKGELQGKTGGKGEARDQATEPITYNVFKNKADYNAGKGPHPRKCWKPTTLSTTRRTQARLFLLENKGSRPTKPRKGHLRGGRMVPHRARTQLFEGGIFSGPPGTGEKIKTEKGLRQNLEGRNTGQQKFTTRQTVIPDHSKNLPERGEHSSLPKCKKKEKKEKKSTA